MKRRTGLLRWSRLQGREGQGGQGQCQEPRRELADRVTEAEQDKAERVFYAGF